MNHAQYKVGDLVSRHMYDHQNEPIGTIIGVVIDVLEPQIYDRSERVLVQWTNGYKSYEKDYVLTRHDKENINDN